MTYPNSGFNQNMGFNLEADPDLTPQKILEGARDLISTHGYSADFIRLGEEYSMPAAFDEVVYKDSANSGMRFMAVQVGIWKYPTAYTLAHDCLLVAWGARVPATQEEALDALNLAIFEASENTDAEIKEKAAHALREAGYLE